MTHAELVNIGLLVVTMLLWGTTPLLEKIGLREVDPTIGVFIRSAAVTIVLAAFLLVTGRFQEFAKVSMKNYTIFAATGIMAGLLAMWTYFYVLRTGMISQVVPITASYPILTAALGILVLGEAATPQRILGIALAVIGIILVKQS
ncbi:MAG: EamA family transporter [Syntrophaceae bacterium]|nr:EamA family transporter [Syntrophaceae bacterium]